jgi:hypothetical protein
MCVPLTCSCNLCRPNCYPTIIRDRIPVPDAAMLQVWEDDRRSMKRRSCPQLQWKSKTRTPEGMMLKWEEIRTGGRIFSISSNSKIDQDLERHRTRSSDTKLLVPWDLFKRRKQLHVRPGKLRIATGCIEEWITNEQGADSPPSQPPPEQPPALLSPHGAA